MYKFGMNDMHALAVLNEGMCISREYKGISQKLKWKCKFGHIWDARPSWIKQGKWCPKCARNRAGQQRIKYSIDDMQVLAKKRNGQCLSSQYLGCDKKLEWKCSDGHFWSAPPDRIRRGSWCPKCSKSKHFTEEKCRYIAEQMTGLQFPSNRILLGRGLEIDLYNADFKIGIEYNGIQHYEFVKGWHKTLEGLSAVQVRDREKAQKCNKLGIALFVIPYTKSKTDEMLVNSVKGIMLQSNISIICDKINFVTFYDKLSSLMALKKLAIERGGRCLSKQYISCETKCKFQCKHGHIFNMQPRHVKSGHWCNECGNISIGNKNRKLTLQDAHRAAEKRGGKCLSASYASSNSKLRWKCSQGHIWDTTFNEIRSGSWCNLCGYQRAGKKLRATLESVQAAAAMRGGKCLSTEYINGKTKLEFECSESHMWMARPDNIKSGKWCPKCKYT